MINQFESLKIWEVFNAIYYAKYLIYKVKIRFI